MTTLQSKSVDEQAVDRLVAEYIEMVVAAMNNSNRFPDRITGELRPINFTFMREIETLAGVPESEALCDGKPCECKRMDFRRMILGIVGRLMAKNEDLTHIMLLRRAASAFFIHSVNPPPRIEPRKSRLTTLVGQKTSSKTT